MMGIREEIIAFLTAVISGIIVRFIYQCIDCFRGIHRHKLSLIELEDIVFWIGTAIYLFVQIYHTSDGSIRWYFVLGIVLGVAFATIFLRKMKKVLKKIYDLHSGKSIAKNEKKRYYNR